RHRLPHVPGARDLKEKPELAALGGLIGALAGVGLDQPWLIVGGCAVTGAGVLLRGLVRLRAARLRSKLSAALSAGSREQIFARVAEVLDHSAHSDWTALVAWEEDGLGGDRSLDAIGLALAERPAGQSDSEPRSATG